MKFIFKSDTSKGLDYIKFMMMKKERKERKTRLIVIVVSFTHLLPSQQESTDYY